MQAGEGGDDEQRVGRCAAVLAAVLRAAERPHLEPDLCHAAQCNGQRRHTRANAAHVGDQHRVCPERLGIGRRVRVERAADLLLALDDELDADRRTAVPGAERTDVRDHVRLRVGRATTEERTVALDRLERRRGPQRFVATGDDVVMRVEENGRGAVGHGNRTGDDGRSVGQAQSLELVTPALRRSSTTRSCASSSGSDGRGAGNRDRRNAGKPDEVRRKLRHQGPNLRLNRSSRLTHQDSKPTPTGRESHDNHLPRPGRDRGGVRLGPAAGRGRGDRRGALALGDRRPRPRPVPRRVRRPGGDLHRRAVRRQRSPRRTGVTAWAGQELINRAGESRTKLLVLTMLLVALLTALISVNGAVAALLPVVVVMAVRLGRSPSQLLLPLAFAAHAGSLLVLTGTPVNVIVSEAADEAGVGGFGYFEFALVGVPLLLGTIAIVVLLGERLLPTRTAKTLPADFSNHARTLVDQYELEQDPATLLTRKYGVAEVVIPPRSSAIGEGVSPGMVTDSGDLVILAVRRNGEDQGGGESVLAVGDTLLLRGKWDALDENLEDPAVLVVDAPALVRRQAVPLGPGAKRVLVILAAMVVLLATGAVPPVVAGLLAAGAIVLLRTSSPWSSATARSRGRP